MATVPPPTFAARSQHGRRGRSGGLRKNNPKKSGVNRMAIIAAVTGVLLLPIPVISLCAGGVAMGQIQRSSRQRGTPLALVGIVLGAIGCVLWVTFWLLVMVKNGWPFPL